MSLRVEAAPAAGQHAVGNPPCCEGFGGARPTNYLIELIELGGGMTQPHGLYVQLHSGRRASAGDCPETARANEVGFPLSPKQI